MIVKSRLRDKKYVPWTCTNCAAEIEFENARRETVTVTCASCQKNVLWTAPSSGTTAHEAEGKFSTGKNTAPKNKPTKKKIGTDQDPLETEYYELLNVSVTANASEIKTAYRKLAIMYHPDKNPDDPAAAERFKNIATAYATLSDPKLRTSYNQFGTNKNKLPAEGNDGTDMVDPEMIFSKLFGGDAFEDIIGTIALSNDMKQAMINAEEDEQNPLSEEEKAKRDEQRKAEEKAADDERTKNREMRVKHLTDVLKRKLEAYVEKASSESDARALEPLQKKWAQEVEELQTESYGADLLHIVGHTYESKSRQYLAATGVVPWGVGGWLYSVKSTYGVVSETVSTVRSAWSLKTVYDEIQKAEEAGDLDKKAKLEETAAQMGLDTMFKGVRLEVTSVIRQVCDEVLYGDTVPTLRKRAIALGQLGALYSKAVKVDDVPPQ